MSALRLLFNISFEPSGREAILQGGLVPKLSKLLRQRQINPLIVRRLRLQPQPRPQPLTQTLTPTLALTLTPNP